MLMRSLYTITLWISRTVVTSDRKKKNEHGKEF